jgi:hypothetical protein
VGEIDANNYGGGVAINAFGFSKTGGTIYGSDGGSDANTKTGGVTDGDAILWYTYWARRDTTAGSGVNLFSLSFSDLTNPPWIF